MTPLTPLLLTIAMAQAPVVPVEPPGPAVGPQDTPSAPSPAPAPTAQRLPLARTSTWTQVGPVGEDGFVDVALHPQRGGIWVAAQRDGTVWVTVDGGGDWIEVLQGAGVRLGSVSRDEELILDVQARVDELADSMDDVTSEEEAEDLAAEAAAAAQDVALGVQGEVEQGLWFDDEGGATLADVGRVRVEFTAAGVLLVSRPDGLKVSPDLGATWIPVLDAPIAHAVEVAPGEVLAVGPQGSWTSSDLVQWTSVSLPMPVPPTDLVVDQGVWASTPDGLWVSREAGWQELPQGPRPLTARPANLGPRPDLLVGSDTDVFRAAPFDGIVDPVIGGPIPNAQDIERLPDGTLIAASSVGPYESGDQGRTWQLLADGLLDPKVDAVGVRGPEVVLVGLAGIWRLDPRPQVLPEAPQRPVELPPFMPLGALIDSSVSRTELRQRIGSRFVAALFPEVRLEYVRVDRQGPDWRVNDPGGTLYDLHGHWVAAMRLTWSPNRQRTGTSFDVDAGNDVPVVVVGNEVVVAGDEAPQVLYSKVTRGASTYRGILAARITELYRLRARLLLDAPPTDVRRAVVRELNLAEVDAKLDALTDGAVSSWKLGNPLPPPPVP